MTTRTLDTPAGRVTIRLITQQQAIDAFNAHPDGAGRIIQLITAAAADPTATAETLATRITALHHDVDAYDRARLLEAGVVGNAGQLQAQPAMTDAALRAVCQAILDWEHEDLDATISPDAANDARAGIRAMCEDWLTQLRAAQ
jgi:hypothetical protein